ncbi:MAG: chemotaxis protein CheY [Deltaproteobacteria bacterium]|nr:chemotaxis protein CheY [Deltaproteobacteria bacterium]
MRKVLVVDDSLCTRKLLSMMLKCHGFTTGEAEDGLDALEKLGTMKVDLVIVEREMPNMDGLSFVKSVRNSFHLLNMPVVMVTDRVGEGFENDALRAGADLILAKPVAAAALISGIEGVLRGRDGQ